jgi:hypothetical protein
MISKYPPPKELQAELDALNVEVTAVLAKRKAWMDAHMEDFSNFKVGDEVYDTNNGQLLGVVTELYRYWDHQRNPLYDTGMNIEISYRKSNRVIDNSSRHAGGGPSFGTREQAHAVMKSRAEYLVWKARGGD